MKIDISPTAFCELKLALTDAIAYSETKGCMHLANRYEELYEQIAYCEKKWKRYYNRLKLKRHAKIAPSFLITCYHTKVHGTHVIIYTK